MANFSGKFQSTKQDWTTPDYLFNPLDAEFKFTIDLAADKDNTKCDVFYSEKKDALQREWHGVCWLNPPYGIVKARLANWMQKAYEQTRKPGCIVVTLIPARTNTNWWHRFVMRAAEIRFIQGRPKFGNARFGLPQPLAVVIFASGSEAPRLVSLKI